MKRKQLGAVAVEFALVFIMWLAFTLVILDIARMLFTWNAANEAARAGARYAVVCDNTGNATLVLNKMQAMLPQIQTINMGWDPPGCNPTSCIGVRVTITGLAGFSTAQPTTTYRFMSPMAGLARIGVITIPDFATYLTREDMRQDPNAAVICP